MGYLTINDLYEMNIIDHNDEKLLLIEPAGEPMTHIEEANDEKKQGGHIDTDAEVFIRQRWKVDVLPADNFSKTFTTHRYVDVYYCSYGKLLEEQDRIYTAWEVYRNKSSETTDLGDDFNFIF